ncbi:hypothetical protein HD806DRAFT_540948 [Xylariaceae sp. AK1471]|nr:hypothetical protein HD806DRAFT_540948 [Xylariaceae sp. AK1471]
MNSNTGIYEMEGSPQTVFNTAYELEGGIPMNMYNSEDPGKQPPVYSFTSQIDRDMTHQWFQVSETRPLYRAGMATAPRLDPSCLFRSEILDDCSKARFYAKALEFYLLDNERQTASYGCPMASCPIQNFKHPKDMLRHLKNCKFFGKGKFWCPTCLRFESFKVRSSKRCSWDKENIASKLIQKSKDVFRGFAGNRSGTQQTSNCAGLCAMCSAPLPDISMHGVHAAPPFGEAHPTQATGPTEQRHQPEPIMLNDEHYELDSAELTGELSGESSSSSSPTQFWAPPYDIISSPPVYRSHTNAVSEVSFLSTSPDGSSSDISPSSSTYVDRPHIASCQNSGGVFNRPTRRVTGSHNEADIGLTHTLTQRSTSLHAEALTSHNFGSLTFIPAIAHSEADAGLPHNNYASTSQRPASFHADALASHNIGSLAAAPAMGALNSEAFVTSSTLPLTLMRQPSYRDVPTLRVETYQGSLDLIPSTPNFNTLILGPQPPNGFTTAARIIPSQLSQGSYSNDGNHFMTPHGNSPLNPSPSGNSPLDPSPSISASTFSISNSQSSPDSSFSSEQQEQKCPHCDFKPKYGKGAYLRKHMDTHKNKEKIPCDRCGKTFTRQDNLTSHLKKIHRVFKRSALKLKRRRGSSDSLQSSYPPKRRELGADGLGEL